MNKAITSHPYMPFEYETYLPTKEKNVNWYQNVRFYNNFGVIPDGSKWDAVEIRIDESNAYIYCREFLNEEDGKVIVQDFQISRVDAVGHGEYWLHGIKKNS